MPFWAQTLLILAAVALMLALVAAVAAALALRRVAQRAESVLTIVAQELRPLVGQAHALTEDVRGLIRETSRELERIGAVTDKVESVADGLARFVGMLGGLTRAGQLVGMAVGLKKGLGGFVQRFRKEQGDDHEGPQWRRRGIHGVVFFWGRARGCGGPLAGAPEPSRKEGRW